jgi:3-methyladenine DNA glycosylase AlkD
VKRTTDGQGQPDAAELERRLRELGTAERAVTEKAYLKIDLEFAGVSVPVMRSAVTGWCHDRDGLAHDELTSVALALWASSLYESRQAAVILLERQARLLVPGDTELIEHLLRNSRTWALVDGLAANVAGDIAERFPADTAPVLDRWAVDRDFWIRRSSMLALLRPLRRGQGDFDRFAGYADAMLEEKEFFIRKAIGWVLRETAKRQPELVATWLAPRVHRASGVTVREAIKPLPPLARDLLLAGYQEKRPVRWPSGQKSGS